MHTCRYRSRSVQMQTEHIIINRKHGGEGGLAPGEYILYAGCFIHFFNPPSQ